MVVYQGLGRVQKDADAWAVTPLRAAGIYVIVHRASGRCYVGNAVNIPRRWRGHVRTLRAGAGQPKLQRAWYKYGERAFAWRVILYCEPAWLLIYEKEMIRLYQAKTKGYNCRIIPESNLGIKFGPPSPETLKKLKYAARDRCPPSRRGKRHTDAARAQMRETKRRNGKKFKYLGQTMTLVEWAEKTGIRLGVLHMRLNRGWTLGRALTQPWTREAHYEIMRERAAII